MTDAAHEAGIHTGRCLCGAIAYRIDGPLVDLGACHCSQCRRQSGHFWASFDVAPEDLTITGMDNVTWYRSSETAERGFCRTCGSFLFWREVGAEAFEISAGSLDRPTGLHLEKHIFVADKGDYYEIADDVPQFPAGGPKDG